MESPWQSKKWIKPQQGKTQQSQPINEGEKLQTCIPQKPGNKNKSINTKQRHIKLCIPNTSTHRNLVQQISYLEMKKLNAV